MITEYIRYAMSKDRAGELEPAYQRAAKWLDQSSHCLGYELSQCTEDATNFILQIHWDSHDGHLKGFRSSEEFKHFFTEVQPFTPFIQEMRHYDLTSVQRYQNAEPSDYAG
jgi:quinol monooxygenase YgiN